MFIFTNKTLFLFFGQTPGYISNRRKRVLSGRLNMREKLPAPLRLNRQELTLVGVTMLWGSTFLIVHNVLDYTGPLFFVGLRFAFSSISMFLISFRVMRGLTLKELWAGCAIGVMIFIGYGFQTFGLQSISSSKSAFITAFYIPLVPVFQWLFMRRRPPSQAGPLLAPI